MSRYAELMSEPVPQTEPLNPRQVKNNAGGFVFTLDDFARLHRFLILGSDSNTYYQSAKVLTKENAACVIRCYAADPARTVQTIVEVSHEGRAPKNDAAIFALALGAVHKDPKVRQLALNSLSGVCRTSTHLFQFVDDCRKLGRGWGRALKRAVARWYDHRSPASVAFQGVKYRSRGNYTHKRLLETARPYADANKPVYRWLKGKLKEGDEKLLPEIIAAHEEAMKMEKSSPRLLDLIREYKLPWEAIPTWVKKDPAVWEVMLPDMGLTALIRNLGAMTAYGTLKPLGPSVRTVVERLADQDELQKARIHPFNVLVAQAAYNSGASVAGQRRRRTDDESEPLSWKPIPKVADALEEAFYLSFKTIEPSGKRTLIGLDVSGSMSSPLMGSPLEVCAGAAAMAMTVMRTEQDWHVMAFADRFKDLRLSAKMSLEDVLQRTRNVNFGGTDCALPMIYAMEQRLEVDVFQVFTDNETWAGSMHPPVALQKYRQKSGIPAKLVVVGMTSTGFTIADPNDAGMLDVVGFDSAAPAVMADFARR